MLNKQRTQSTTRPSQSTFDVDGIHLELPCLRTLREVASLIDISPQAIQEIEQRAMRKVIRKLKFQLTVLDNAT